MSTCYVLRQAANCQHEPETKVYMDSGVENLNRDVDKLLEDGTLERVVVQTDVTFSNSLIESWWRSLKHGWLFINHLDNVVTLRNLIDFYVAEHNQRMPHSAFHGQTPDEMYFGRGATIPDELALKRREAQMKRVDQNRKTGCSDCTRGGAAIGKDVAA